MSMEEEHKNDVIAMLKAYPLIGRYITEFKDRILSKFKEEGKISKLDKANELYELLRDYNKIMGMLKDLNMSDADTIQSIKAVKLAEVIDASAHAAVDVFLSIMEVTSNWNPQDNDDHDSDQLKFDFGPSVN